MKKILNESDLKLLGFADLNVGDVMLIGIDEPHGDFAIGTATAGSAGWRYLSMLSFERDGKNLPIQKWAEEYYPAIHRQVADILRSACSVSGYGEVTHTENGLPKLMPKGA